MDARTLYTIVTVVIAVSGWACIIAPLVHTFILRRRTSDRVVLLPLVGGVLNSISLGMVVIYFVAFR